MLGYYWTFDFQKSGIVEVGDLPVDFWQPFCSFGWLAE
jgi:hypothetical protein